MTEASGEGLDLLHRGQATQASMTKLSSSKLPPIEHIPLRGQSKTKQPHHWKTPQVRADSKLEHPKDDAEGREDRCRWRSREMGTENKPASNHRRC